VAEALRLCTFQAGPLNEVQKRRTYCICTECLVAEQD